MPNPFDTIIPVFPNLIHCIKVDNFKDIQEDLINFVYEEESLDPIGVIKSNEGGWQSKAIYSHKESIVRSTLENTLSNYFSNTDIFSHNKQITISNSWLNINRNRDNNRLHNHPETDLSGVFWIKIPENCDAGRIQFPSPYDFLESKVLKLYSENVKKSFNEYDTYHFQSTEGIILIFPAHLMHEVRENKSREDRISLSFNLHINK